MRTVDTPWETRTGGRPSVPRAGRGGLAALCALTLCALTLAAGLAALALGGYALHLGSDVATTLRTGTARATAVEDVVALVVVTVGAVLAAWLAVSAGLCLGCAAARGVGHVWRTGERLAARVAPHAVRRLTAAAVGTGVALAVGLSPAHAAPDLDPGWQPTRSERAATAPDPRPPLLPVTSAPSAAPPAARTAPTAAPVTPVRADDDGGSNPARTPVDGHGDPDPTPEPSDEPAVTVRPGDSLWSITAAHLPADAVVADVAAAWPRWYEANRAVIGPDPDLIHPGQVLHPPAPDTEPARSTER